MFNFRPPFVSAKECACNASSEYITNLIKGLSTVLLKTRDWVTSVYITPEVSFKTLMHFPLHLKKPVCNGDGTSVGTPVALTNLKK